MLNTFRTLLQGANSRAEEKVQSTYSHELIDKKIRESVQGLGAAKSTLASMIQRERAEARAVTLLEQRVADLTDRARKALEAGHQALVAEAAEAIATMENELTLRRETAQRLASRILRLRASVEATHRRIIDLKQGAITARALRIEQTLQARVNTTLGGPSPMAEAEELIAHVMAQEDPLEQAEILTQIDATLSHDDIAQRMAASGFGPALKCTAADVMTRLTANH